MRNEKVGGILLVIGAALAVLVMLFHPHGHELLDAANHAKAAHQNQVIHGTAILAMPMIFLGLLALHRRLASDLSTAGISVFGLAVVAVVNAALASGFTGTWTLEKLRTATPEQKPIYEAIGGLVHSANQSCAMTYVLASSIAFFLFSLAIHRSGRLPKLFAYAGYVVAIVLFSFVIGGHLRLEVHGFGVVMFSQAAWLLGLGVALIRVGNRGSSGN